MGISTFYDLEARKIAADGEKVALFTKHPGTLGAYRESRLRQYVAEHAPKRFAIASGFVSDHDADGNSIYDRSSLQIDCLVHDQTEYAPLLQAIDFAVVIPRAVAAVVEIKSNLTLFKERAKVPGKSRWEDKDGEYEWAGTLVDALNNMKSAIGVLEAAGVKRDHYFAGVIGYASTSIGQLANAMSSGELWKQLDIGNIDQLPSSICIVNGAWYLISAFPWVDDPETEGTGDSDSASSYLIQGSRATEGSSLQMFTAELHHTLTVSRQRSEHVVGGLRSGKGYTGKVTNHKIGIPSPRQHEEE